ncbi:MAG TPA: Na+/H+ antiporter [Chthoniobacterales bacterium]|nr:Na+/H+ antiporter [Chthoniobacterales bacterium]
MQQAEIIVFLFTLVAALVLVARRIAVPYPVLLVLAGLTLSLIPRLPEMRLQPDIVFYFFLPALIYPAALFTSWRDFRRNLRPILLLAIGLVLFTTVVIAWVTHWLLPDLPWAAAFALGAIVSPPDAVAATSVIRRLGVPHRLEVTLEGESLVNDATALVALQFAVAALVSGSFSIEAAAGRFVLAGAGGVAFGLVVGLLMRWVQRHLDDPPVQITFSLLTPFLAYLPAEYFHLSGVLATVTAGIYLGWHSPLIISARTRLQASAFWEMISFLLNGFVFITIGLQLRGILREIRGDSLTTAFVNALLISAAVVIVRIGWVFSATYVPRFLFKTVRRRNPYPGWRNVAILAWAGMRGVISLAAAFALPFTLPDGRPFPGRNYILFFTFCVILTTLVFQGLTLPLIIRKLRIARDRTTDDEERSARFEANKAALQALDQFAREKKFPGDAVDRLRAEYADRLEQIQLCSENPDDCTGQVATLQYQRLQQEALRIERQTIIELRNRHVINDDALRRIQRDLDLAEARLTG